MDFSRMKNIGAMVDTVNKIIYLPNMDVRDPDSSRKLRAYLNHECAHIRYYDFSYQTSGPFTPPDDSLIHRISGIIDDIRIEILLEQDDSSIHEDFKFLIDFYWNESYTDSSHLPGQGLNGDFSKSLLGSLYWKLQQQYRGASLFSNGESFKPLPNFNLVFDFRVRPLLDPFMLSEEPAYGTASRLVKILKVYYPEFL
jgi:hypothetical protein